MAGFHREQHELWCDGVHLAEIARHAGTPVHVYSAPLIAERYRALDRALAACPHRLHYALKANSTLAVARLLRSLGASADANSGGEIEVALRAGFTPGDIVFTGVGKTHDELARAISLGVAAVNAESPGEVERIAAIATAHATTARIAVRINPDVDARSHPHISTGLSATKFGVPVDDARTMIRDMSGRAGLKVVGLHCHVGSQVASLEPLVHAARRLAELAAELSSDGVKLEHLDLGGGLGIAYGPAEDVPSIEDYAAAIGAVIGPTGLTLLLEPGRSIVGPAGALVTSVVDLKRHPHGGWFVVVDAGMTDVLRPALYGAWHAFEAVTPREGHEIQAEIVGPVCETSDTLGSRRRLPPVLVGDFLAMRDTGAYGAVMASNYNRRPMAAEVMVENGKWRVVRRRQTVADMLQWDE
jgi:diaminopimelate decarboxylase